MDLGPIVMGLNSAGDVEAAKQSLVQLIYKHQPYNVPRSLAPLGSDAATAAAADVVQQSAGDCFQKLANYADQQQLPLPAGWQESWSKEYCCYYYSHGATGASTYERPA